MFESMNIKYLEYLSSGLTSSVYKGEFMNKKIDHGFVIKQFKNNEYFEQELKIMKLISNSINQKAKEFVINIIGEATFRLDNHSTNTMLLTPFCYPTEGETSSKFSFA